MITLNSEQIKRLHKKLIDATGGAFAVLSLIGYLNHRKQMKIQRQLDEDEQDD